MVVDEKMLKVRSTRRNRNGSQCGNLLKPGQVVCHIHGGGRHCTAQPPGVEARLTATNLIAALESLGDYTPQQLTASLKRLQGKAQEPE
jgi:hypothetical protein